jgi:hypothetical protein
MGGGTSLNPGLRFLAIAMFAEAAKDRDVHKADLHRYTLHTMSSLLCNS